MEASLGHIATELDCFSSQIGDLGKGRPPRATGTGRPRRLAIDRSGQNVAPAFTM